MTEWLIYLLNSNTDYVGNSFHRIPSTTGSLFEEGKTIPTKSVKLETIQVLQTRRLRIRYNFHNLIDITTVNFQIAIPKYRN